MALGLPRSTYYDQLEKGNLITADNLRKVATNLGINQAELLIRYRLIHPEEIRSLTDEIGGSQPFALPPPGTGVIMNPVKAIAQKRAKNSHLRPRRDAPPL
jgi:hypothetical protein